VYAGCSAARKGVEEAAGSLSPDAAVVNAVVSTVSFPLVGAWEGRPDPWRPVGRLRWSTTNPPSLYDVVCGVRGVTIPACSV